MEKVCKDYMLSRHPYKKNKGCTRNNCKYIHDEHLCYFFYKDNCNKGDDCKFNHVVDNIIPLDKINPWSVNRESMDTSDIASKLFSISIIPYLVLLYYLSKPKTFTPKLGNFGFQFLLVFVFATIPAGIYAKSEYHDILANVDWLHGGAEFLLTITNLFIVFGVPFSQEKRGGRRYFTFYCRRK